MASSSLILPSSLSPKSLFLSKPTTKSSPFSLFFNSFSLKTTTNNNNNNNNNNKSFSISSAFNSETSYTKSVTSGFDQEEKEEVVSRERTDLNSAKDEFKLYVGNLSVNVDSAQLVRLFESAGNVEMAKVIYDKMTGKSRGFAFVYMSTVEEAKAAAKKLDGYKLEGRGTITVNYGSPPSREKNRWKAPRSGGGIGGDSYPRCYVGNLSGNVDDETLMTLFDVPGKVLEARVVYDRDGGRSMGFGFVTYSSYEEVENAISSYNGFELNGKKIRVCAAKESL